MKRIAAKTLGCKTNQYETEAILSRLPTTDYKIVDFSKKADIFIINTCCVTHKAEAKSRYEIRKIIKNFPHARIIVTGCYVDLGADFLQNNKKRLELYENDSKSYIADNIIKERSIIKKSEPHLFPELPLEKPIFHSRVPVKIQDGCNLDCAYCILPHVRGKPRSRKPDSIFRQIKKLNSQGVKEIVLTGINLGLYGVDLEDWNFKKLLQAITNKTEIKKIRISSLEPMFLDKEFINYLAEDTKILPHYHISLQSGCDKILKNMNRTYDTSQASNILTYLQNRIPDAAIGCDVIVGFPSETENDFKETYRFIKYNPIHYLHVFRFSERPGTKAAVMEDKVHSRHKKRRMRNLLALSKNKKQKYAQYLITNNINLRVIAEQNEKNHWFAVSDHYIKTKFVAKNITQGSLVKLKSLKYLNRSQTMLSEPI